MSPPPKQKPTRPTLPQKPTRPKSPRKSTPPISPSKRPTGPPKASRPSSSKKPSRPTSSRKPNHPASPQKPTPPKPIPQKSRPQKSFWASRKNSSKQSELTLESTKDNKVSKKNKSKENVHVDYKPAAVQQSDGDTQSLFGRVFRRNKYKNNDVIINRAQELVDDAGAKKKKKNGNTEVLTTLKSKDTVKLNRSRNNSQSSESPSTSDEVPTKNKFKRMLRRQAWRMSKGSIKRNPRLSALLAENHININNIKPEEIDISLINVDALGIKNKFLERTVTWLLK